LYRLVAFLIGHFLGLLKVQCSALMVLLLQALNLTHLILVTFFFPVWWVVFFILLKFFLFFSNWDLKFFASVGPA
jgi:hypothetical protein